MEPIYTIKDPSEDLLKLEAQFILRLPFDISENVRKLLKRKPKKIKKYMKISMNPETRQGEFILAKNLIPLKLVDLPTIIESLKTIDKKVFFKTADIHQMYLGYVPEENNNIGESKDQFDKQYLWPHGLAPPLKNVRKCRFRKTMKNKQPLDGPEIEKEVKWLLKMDNEAIAVRWELVDEEQFCQKNENLNLSGGTADSDCLELIDEKDVFGDMSDSISEEEFQGLLQEYQEEPEDGEMLKSFHKYLSS